jgi:hypothetical protein
VHRQQSPRFAQQSSETSLRQLLHILVDKLKEQKSFKFLFILFRIFSLTFLERISMHGIRKNAIKQKIVIIQEVQHE